MQPWSVGHIDQAAAHVVKAGVTYTGPGDIVSGAIGWWGLRAYSLAKCTGSVAAIRIVKASDGSAAQDINILTSGSLDVATISGLGYAVKVTKIYDQSGNGIDVSQATLANMPTLTLSAIGALPAMTFANAATSKLTSTGNINFTQPFSMNFVAKRTTVDSYAQVLGGSTSNPIYGFSNSADNVLAFAGNVVGASATDNVLHAVQIMASGASTIINVDGTPTTVDAGISGSATTTQIGADSVDRGLTGILAEVGAWTGDKSGNFAALRSNQQIYWGTP